jgi:spermidine/putrescine transport system permease protein
MISRNSKIARTGWKPVSRWSWLAVVAILLVGIPARADLDLFAWSEYVPQEVIDGFTKETGIKVHYETYASNEEMLSKLLAGASNYDLIQPSEYTVEALIQKQKLAPIDWSAVPNIKNIDPAFLHMGFDPQQKFSVPWMTGTVGIVVNTDRIKEPIRGYRDVFQQKYKNRIVVVNDNREIVTWAMETLGLPINDVTRANLLKVKPLLASWIPRIKVYDSDSPKTPLINGDCDLGVVWSGEAALCWQQDHKFEYVLPAEGAHEFIDSLCIPATAAHKADAEKFLNYILRPEVSKMISDKFPYTNPNAAARKLMSKEQLANPASYPKPRKLEIFHPIGKGTGMIDRLMTELKSNG